MILNPATTDSSIHVTLLGAIATVSVVASLVAILVKCACCGQAKPKEVLPLNALVKSNTVEGLADQQNPVEIASEKSEPVSQRKKSKIAMSKRDALEVSSKKSVEDSVVHGRSPSQVGADFRKQMDKLAVISEIEHTPPNEQPRLASMPSLPPPSLDLRRTKCYEPRSHGSLHYLDVSLEKLGRTKSIAPETKSRSVAAVSTTLVPSTSKVVAVDQPEPSPKGKVPSEIFRSQSQPVPSPTSITVPTASVVSMGSKVSKESKSHAKK